MSCAQADGEQYWLHPIFGDLGAMDLPASAVTKQHLRVERLGRSALRARASADRTVDVGHRARHLLFKAEDAPAPHGSCGLDMHPPPRNYGTGVVPSVNAQLPLDRHQHRHAAHEGSTLPRTLAEQHYLSPTKVVEVVVINDHSRQLALGRGVLDDSARYAPAQGGRFAARPHRDVMRRAG